MFNVISTAINMSSKSVQQNRLCLCLLNFGCKERKKMCTYKLFLSLLKVLFKFVYLLKFMGRPSFKEYLKNNQKYTWGGGKDLRWLEEGHILLL